jgi:hypothetical protein
VALLLPLLPLKGTLLTTPTAEAPGWREMSFNSLSLNARRAGQFGYLFHGTEICAVRT